MKFLKDSLRRSRSLNSSNGPRTSQSRRLNSSQTVRNNTRRNHNNLYKDDDDEENLELSGRDGVYNFTNNLTDLNVNTSSSANRNILSSNGRNMPQTVTINEDKPPEYTQLFPIRNEEPTSAINTPKTKSSTAVKESSENNQTASASPITTVSSQNVVEPNNITQL